MKLEHKIGIAIGMCTITGMLWAAFSKPASWDQVVKDMADMKPKVEDHGTRIARIEAHYSDIKDTLHEINRKLDDDGGPR